MAPSEWLLWETSTPVSLEPTWYGYGRGHDPEHAHGTSGAIRASERPGQVSEQDQDMPVVLIAEDEETIAESLAMIVEEAGYRAIVALDGRQALVLARQCRPALILTDLMMPFLSGSDLIASVRRDAAASGEGAPPIALITAASRARAEEAGADIVVSKPFDVVRIEELLHRFLAEKPQQTPQTADD